MKSKIAMKIGLLLTGAATLLVSLSPGVALWLAELGDRLTALALHLHCYGR